MTPTPTGLGLPGLPGANTGMLGGNGGGATGQFPGAAASMTNMFQQQAGMTTGGIGGLANTTMNPLTGGNVPSGAMGWMTPQQLSMLTRFSPLGAPTGVPESSNNSEPTAIFGNPRENDDEAEQQNVSFVENRRGSHSSSVSAQAQLQEERQKLDRERQELKLQQRRLQQQQQILQQAGLMPTGQSLNPMGGLSLTPMNNYASMLLAQQTGMLGGGMAGMGGGIGMIPAGAMAGVDGNTPSSLLMGLQGAGQGWMQQQQAQQALLGSAFQGGIGGMSGTAVEGDSGAADDSDAGTTAASNANAKADHSTRGSGFGRVGSSARRLSNSFSSMSERNSWADMRIGARILLRSCATPLASAPTPSRR